MNYHSHEYELPFRTQKFTISVSEKIAGPYWRDFLENFSKLLVTYTRMIGYIFNKNQNLLV